MPKIIEAIKNGYIDIVNPRNTKMISRLSTSFQDVKAWIWRSKNYQPWIQCYSSDQQLFDQYSAHILNFNMFE